MDILNYNEFKNFAGNIPNYDTRYDDSVPITIWNRYVKHINNVMKLEPSIRFTCNLETLKIDYNRHRGYAHANYDKEYLFPRNFTVAGNLHMFLLKNVKIPDDLIVDGHVVFQETFVKNIPINLYNAKSVFFRAEYNDSIKIIDDFYNEVVLPIESNFIIKKYRESVFLKPK